MYFNHLPLIIQSFKQLLSMCWQLEDAVKIRDISQTESRYKDTKIVLQEVMDRMA